MKRQHSLFRWIKDLSIAWKFSLTLVLVVTITTCAILITLHLTLIKSLYREHDNKEVAIARNVATNSIDPFFLNASAQLKLLLNNTKESENDIVYAFIRSAENKIIAHSFDGGFPQDLGQIRCNPGNSGYGQRRIITELGLIDDMCVPILNGKIGYVHLGYSQKEIENTVHALYLQITIIAFLISTLAVIIGFLISKLISNPLVSLKTMAEKISQGDMDYRVKVSQRDEVGIVSHTFNTMAIKLKSDIGRLEAMQKTILAREAQYKSLVENIQLGVALIDPNHTVKMVNPSLANLLQTDPEDLKGKKCFQEFEKQEQICENCPGIRAMESGRSHEVIKEFIENDGSKTTIRLTSFPVISDSGSISGFIEVVENITERLSLEEEIQRAKKIESIGILAGGIAHDFNNLLTGILGNISLARLCIDEKETLLEKLTETEKATIRAKDLTQQLLTFSKGGAPVFSPTDIKHLIKETTDFTLSGSNITCEYSFAENLHSVKADSGQISQVIQNIITNAKQAMNNGGKITITATNRDITDKDTLPLPAGKYLEMSITDNGPGIAMEYIDKIFDPYFTNKKDGSGLGLSICYSIIKRHGGGIFVESEPGQGTTFTIYLQVTSEQPAAGLEKEKKAYSGNEKILIMDDEAFVRDVATAMLKQLGFKTEVAKDGQEAIDLYIKAKESGQAFDAVIMDLTIPCGMGGKEAIGKLLEYDPDTIAIVSSGYSNDPVMSDFAKYGFCGVIEKPYELEALSQQLSTALSKV